MKNLNQTSLEISAMGLGCMGMSEFYGQTDDQNSLRILEEAFDSGINFFDTADTYGHGHNEKLLAQFIAHYRNQRDAIVIATKFGIVRDQNHYERRIDNTPNYIHQACEASLTRLGIEQIDLYYCHRRQTEVPIEDVTGTLSDLIRQGKIKSFGFSEISAQSLKRANAVAPVTAVQSEYSLWSREPEQELLQTCSELNVDFVAYSPLGRAFLTADLNPATMDAQDFRKHLPRLQGDSFQKNQLLLEKFSQICASWKHSNAQVALAWLMGKFTHVTPIFGTRQSRYLQDNLKANQVMLSDIQIQQLDQLFSPEHIQGDRYPQAGWAGIEKF
ncbi:aldo/keto reductase [Acinetobacter bereziniae]|uniref:aldo/keto reductase n=1 Tax=Acinetobacter bereziniae TaxID=106648 RepID=UPI0020760473|nr:aldo/keto reductase [Acinetobacter bereziniae]MCM8511324.1 aldo/keto reductase [Acinetobacter bereziniae]